MVVGRSIYNSCGHTLLKEKTILTERYIGRLAGLGIHYLYITSSLGLPVTSDVVSEETRVNAMVRVRTLLVDAGSGGIALNTEASSQSVSDMVDELLNNKLAVINLADIRIDDDYLFSHSVNVCVLALLTGVSLGYSRSRLHDLGLGAILHDIGKMQVPKWILDKPSSLTPEEYALVKLHSEHGYHLLGNLPIARQIAYSHHERFDGSGYPRGISGTQLSEESQITGLADVFDALTARRSYKPGYPPHEACEFISATGNTHFDIKLVRAFLSNVAAYPTGTMVELSDGCIALTLDTPHAQPLLPRVRCLFDQELRNIAVPLELSLGDTALHVRRVLPADDANRLLSQV